MMEVSKDVSADGENNSPDNTLPPSCHASSTPCNTEFKPDVAELFEKMGKKLGWFQYGDINTALKSPAKSVVIATKVRGKNTDGETLWKLGDDNMPVVDKTTHVGVLRTSTNKPTGHVENNISKAQRTMYGLMAAGLHGENGLDPETSLHLFRIYVIPILTYGLEIYLPTGPELKSLDTFFKRTLKHILSIPITAADLAPYILAGFIPIEGIIHQKALPMFGNISRLPDTAIEKKIAMRQLTVKSHKSPCWFVSMETILLKYNLPSPLDILQAPLSKTRWKTVVDNSVNRYWMDILRERATTYSTLIHLSVENYKIGKVHPNLRLGPYSEQEANRISVKTKLLTGTYILQTNRAVFNNTEVDPQCLMCKTETETLHHFLIVCPALHSARQILLGDIVSLLSNETNTMFYHLELYEQVQCIIDHHRIIHKLKDTVSLELEHKCRLLCYVLHARRYKLLSLLPPRKRYGL